MTLRLALVMLAGLTVSCGGGGGGSSPTSPSTGGSAGTTSCTTLGQCTFVRDALQSYYYWYKELPDPDPGSFPSPEAYLDAVRYRALDSNFSYITSKAASDAFYSESQFIGFGLSYKATGATELRLAQVFPGSPAADAGPFDQDCAASHPNLQQFLQHLAADGGAIAGIRQLPAGANGRRWSRHHHFWQQVRRGHSAPFCGCRDFPPPPVPTP